MKDQYDHDVPTDLLVLDVNPGDLTEEDLAEITRATWYVTAAYRGDRILVSRSTVTDVAFILGDPRDHGIDPAEAMIRIDEPLKRWSAEDGFYHA